MEEDPQERALRELEQELAGHEPENSSSPPAPAQMVQSLTQTLTQHLQAQLLQQQNLLQQHPQAGDAWKRKDPSGEGGLGKRMKTELCKPFQSGFCQRGNSCPSAHFLNELPEELQNRAIAEEQRSINESMFGAAPSSSSATPAPAEASATPSPPPVGAPPSSQEGWPAAAAVQAMQAGWESTDWSAVAAQARAAAANNVQQAEKEAAASAPAAPAISASSKGKTGRGCKGKTLDWIAPEPNGPAPKGSMAPKSCGKGGPTNLAGKTTATALSQVTQAPWFKTQPCRFFPMGKCSKGENCTYAHNESEQRNLMRGAFSARRQYQADMTVNVTTHVQQGKIKEVQEAARRATQGGPGIYKDWT